MRFLTNWIAAELFAVNLAASFTADVVSAVTAGESAAFGASRTFKSPKGVPVRHQYSDLSIDYANIPHI